MKQRVLLDYLIASLSSSLSSDDLLKPRFEVVTNAEHIWEQKVFCLLSSQFSAARAAQVANSLVREIPFFDAATNISGLEQACFQVLSRPSVGYRFPRVRARQISLCWFPFAQIKDTYHEFVHSFASEQQARDEIAESFPGIGLKQASMFLRNIGASRNLAVIDVHILFYLRTCYSFDSEHLSPRAYSRAEDMLRQDAERHGLELNVFDAVVWSAARAVKKISANV